MCKLYSGLSLNRRDRLSQIPSSSIFSWAGWAVGWAIGKVRAPIMADLGWPKAGEKILPTIKLPKKVALDGI